MRGEGYCSWSMYLLSPSSRPPLTLLSPSSHPPLTLLSPSSHPPLSLLSPSSLPPLTLLSACIGSIPVARSFFASSSGPIFLDNAACVGNETRLLDCFSRDKLGKHDCSSSEHAGVICPGKWFCVHCTYMFLNERWEGKKKEVSKVKQTNKAKQHSTPKAVTFPRKNELPQVGLEPTTLYTVHVLMRDEKEGRKKQARSHVHVLMRDEKEGRKKQARLNKQQGKATQNTQGSHLYSCSLKLRDSELSQAAAWISESICMYMYVRMCVCSHSQAEVLWERWDSSGGWWHSTRGAGGDVLQQPLGNGVRQLVGQQRCHGGVQAAGCRVRPRAQHHQWVILHVCSLLTSTPNLSYNFSHFNPPPPPPPQIFFLALNLCLHLAINPYIHLQTQCLSPAQRLVVAKAPYSWRTCGARGQSPACWNATRPQSAFRTVETTTRMLALTADVRAQLGHHNCVCIRMRSISFCPITLKIDIYYNQDASAYSGCTHILNYNIVIRRYTHITCVYIPSN